MLRLPNGSRSCLPILHETNHARFVHFVGSTSASFRLEQQGMRLMPSGKVQLDGSGPSGHRWSDRRMSLLPACRRQGRGGYWPPFAGDRVFEAVPVTISTGL
jgi:hypothetical protein